MKSLISFLQDTKVFLIFALAALLPIFFTPLTSEFYDTGKFLLLSWIALILFLLWGIKSVLENKIFLVKTPIDLFLLVLALVAILSTVFSQTPNPALFGALPKVFGSLLFILSIILTFFMVTSSIKGEKQISWTLSLLTISTTVASLVSLLAYFKLYLPFKFASFQGFSLAGSPGTSAILAALVLPLVLTQLLKYRHINFKNLQYYLPALVLSLVTLILLSTIILVGSLAAWVAGLFSLGVTLYLNRPSKEQIGLIGIISLMGLILAIFSFTPTLKSKTFLGSLANEFQREVQLPFDISWKISASSFRDSPILGTGPATYLYNFTQYKPVEVNLTPFWNVRVSSAYNFYLQAWAELGGAGVLLLILISAVTILVCLKHSDETGLKIAVLTFILVAALHPLSVPIQGAGFLLLALIMAKNGKETVVDFASGSNYLFLSLLVLPIILIALAGFYYTGKLTIGEFYNRQAILSVSQNKGLDAYNNLIRAEKINPKIDAYRINLAQTSFTLANMIAAQKGPTEASPEGSLTEADKTNIQQLLQQAIAEGRSAVALAPRSAGNWEVLASIYRQIQGVAQNALQFSLDSYGRAIQLDPLNPVLRLTVGGIYYQAKNYDLAVRFFDDTVSLKPDYQNGLYNLAIALRDKGNIQEAIQVTERLIGLLQDKPDSDDYKTASKLLAELKEKLPPTAEPTTQVPSSALEQKNLPKVLNLPKQENIATPPAVKK